MIALKWIGAAVVLLACGSVGVGIRHSHCKELQTLKMLIAALDYMECELQFRMPSLPELCRLTANECDGVLHRFFTDLSMELENQISPDVKHCVRTVLTKATELPASTAEALELMGKSIGRFDLQGQLKGLEFIRAECRVRLNKLMVGGDTRLRSYQTLGLCAGAAIVILLV